MTQTLTKRDLVERGVEALLEQKPPSEGVTVQHHAAGGVSQVNLPQVVEVAKFMAACQEGVPPHCRGNVGICLRVTFQAVEWQMSPFSVADMSFIVSGRLGYQSQLLHAVVEGRAPLMHRLECEYLGDGENRQCIVRGHFITGDLREYISPKIKDIKIKNSPLWVADPDQQLFYFASRSWARKWCPDVLLGCYTREEIQRVDLEDHTPQPGLHARLAGSARSEEGHRPGHVAAELDHIENGPQEPAGSPVVDAAAGEAEPAARQPKRTSGRRRAKAGPVPIDAAGYVEYARAWMKSEPDMVTVGLRWQQERAMRNRLGVTAEDRKPLDELLAKLRGSGK